MADNESGHTGTGERAGERGGGTGGKLGKARDKDRAKGRGKAGRVWTNILAVLLVIGGIAIFAYPSVADLLASREHTEVIDSYQKKTATMPSDKVKAELGAARTYNEDLNGDPVHDPFVSDSGYVLPTNYSNVLNVNHDGVMGYLSISRISLKLPIYHGTSEDVLAKGVGHMSQTSLPIGGKGTHAVLTGHRGASLGRAIHKTRGNAQGRPVPHRSAEPDDHIQGDGYPRGGTG